MKKQLALGIAGVSAALIGGWRLVQQLADRKDETATTAGAASSGVRSETGSTNTGKQTAKTAEATKPAEPSATPSKDASKAELYEIAQQLKIEGRSKMSKDELLEAIERAI